ncbi:MAG TPA: alpha/beta hydrolase [Propionibacteriaceae bacterium]|nr:alpha/beta hydrolase [Propionibacteriaceae bacterium]
MPTEPTDAERPTTRRRRGIVVLRRLVVGLLALVVALTVASVAFNVATQPPTTIDPGFGHFVRVGSADVHYQEWGTSGSPIVLVPGFLESSIVWSSVGPILGAHHRVYALDLPGPGYTRYPGPMTLTGQADLVDGFVRALGLRRPLLVGHSLGAAIVGSLALRHPQDAGGLVFADGDALPIGLGPRWQRALLVDSPFFTTALRAATRWPWAARRVIASSCANSCPAATDALAREWVRPLGQGADEGSLRQLMANADYGLSPAQIAAIAVPTTIVWGSADHQGGSLSDTITNLHHPPVHIIEGARHLTMLAQPQAFARAVEAARLRA